MAVPRVLFGCFSGFANVFAMFHDFGAEGADAGLFGRIRSRRQEDFGWYPDGLGRPSDRRAVISGARGDHLRDWPARYLGMQRVENEPRHHTCLSAPSFMYA